MARRPKSDVKRERAPDPELTRSGYPELTRCDCCGGLDAGTQPTLEFNDHPGDGWIWLHPECRPFFKPIVVERKLDSKDHLISPRFRGGPTVDELMTPHKCAYCNSDVGLIQLVAFGRPSRLDVHEAWLHPDCERAYKRMIEDPED
jgi:hypothetical protein